MRASVEVPYDCQYRLFISTGDYVVLEIRHVGSSLLAPYRRVIQAVI